MKKIFSFLILVLILIFSVGCFENEYVSNEGSIELKMSEDYSKYMAYTAPSFTLSFDGVINTIAGINYSYYTSFSHNDDLVLSSLIESLLTKSPEKVKIVIDDVKQSNKTFLNRIIDGEYVSGKVDVDDSTRYYETAYILQDNGLIIAVTYCRFVSNGVTIYRFRETKNIEIAVMYPLMVIEENGERKFVITPLPFLVSNKVSASSTKNVEQIIGNSDYVGLSDTDVSFYVYDYPQIDNSKEECMNFYTNFFNVTISEDEGVLEYMGYSFMLHFYDSYFTIRPIYK